MAVRVSKATARKLGVKVPATPKYRNKRVRFDGIVFGSKKEADRYRVLKALSDARLIIGLAIHPVFAIVVRNIEVAVYEADFSYQRTNPPGLVVEDVKSPITAKNPVYRLKKKLVEAIYGITITEV